MYRTVFFALLSGCIFLGLDKTQAQNKSAASTSHQSFKCIAGERLKLPRSLFIGQQIDTAPDRPLAGDTCPAGQVMTMIGDKGPALPKGSPGITNEGAQANSAYCPNQSCVFFYNSAAQYPMNALAAYGAFTIDQPYVSPSDYHSLAELAVESADGRQKVEVGWTVDPALNGDASPHLFVFYWVNDKPAPEHNAHYNSGFVCLVATSSCPGKLLAVTNTPQLAIITHILDAWVIVYGSQVLGYFPDSLWSTLGVSFTNIGLIQWFGEVDASGSTPKTWMGDGVLGTYPNAASVTTMGYLNTNYNLVPATPSTMVTNPAYYTIGQFKGSSFNYGGPNQTLNFSNLYVPGTSVIFDPDSVLTAAQLAPLGSNGPLGATPAVKALSFNAIANQTMTFSATGLTGCCSVEEVGPDGYTYQSADITSLGSISGFAAPTGLPLVGVFTNGSPTGAAPADYDYSSGIGQSTFSPQLNQVFFIGDGVTGTGSGSTQTFNVPPKATELWLGFPEGGYFDGPPSDYGDNPGGMTVSGTLNSGQQTSYKP